MPFMVVDGEGETHSVKGTRRWVAGQAASLGSVVEEGADEP